MKTKANILIIVSVCIAIGIISTWYYTDRGSKFHTEIYDTISISAYKLQNLDIQLRDNLSQNFSNKLSHYDAIGADIQSMSLIIESLSNNKNLTEGELEEYIFIQLEQILDSFHPYQQSIERINSDLAAIQNSLNYLPVIILESAVVFESFKPESKALHAHSNLLSQLNFHTNANYKNLFNDFFKRINSSSVTIDIRAHEYLSQIKKHGHLVQTHQARIVDNLSNIKQIAFSGLTQQLIASIVEHKDKKYQLLKRIQYFLQIAIWIASGLALLGFFQANKNSKKLIKENIYRTRMTAALANLAEYDNRVDDEGFIDLCVQNLIIASRCYIAYIAFFTDDNKNQLKTASVFNRHEKLDNFTYDLSGAPCENVIMRKTCAVESQVSLRYPNDQMLTDLSLEAYFGHVLTNTAGEPIGLIVLTYQQQTKKEYWLESLLNIFATRISIELDRNQTTQTLSIEREEALTTLDAIADGVIQVNTEGTVTAMNPAAIGILCLEDWNKSSGFHINDISGLSDDTNNLGQHILQYLEPETSSDSRTELFVLSRTGKKLTLNLSVAPIFDKGRKVLGVIAVMQDISKELKYREDLAYHASHDSLTGLLNRRTIDIRINDLLSEDTSHAPYAILYIDIDRFKIVNDTCGHRAGDMLLREISTQLKEQIGINDILGRLGGDEFLLVLSQSTLDDAKAIARKIIESFTIFRFFWDNHEFEISVSIGITTIENIEQNGTQALVRADMACLKAKNSGRNKFHVALPDDPSISIRRKEGLWIQRLTNAINENLFELYQQPIVQAPYKEDAHTSHVEILLRMRDSSNKLIQPHEFLGAAERYNLMLKIDKWVINSVLTRFANSDTRTSFSDINQIAINLSGQSLTDNTLLEYILSELEHNSIDPHRICFEITETAAIANFSYAKTLISELQTIGVNIALDDFGSGLSSYNYIQNLPANFLKLDRRFTKNLVENHINRAIVRSVIEVAHSIDMKVVCEGIEEDISRKIVEDLGVDYMQGYLFGYPFPVTENSIISH